MGAFAFFRHQFVALLTHVRLPRPLSWIALLISLSVVPIYWSGLYGPFYFDDGPNILDVESVRMGSITFQTLRDALGSGSAGPLGRPVSQLSFALNYFFQQRFDPLTFKATNLGIHLVAGWLAFALAASILGARRLRLDRRAIHVAAAIASLTWMCHPIQLLPVLYVVQRMTSLSALFLFAALLLHIQARESEGCPSWWRLAIAWGILWPLSFFSKESGLLFPIFVIAYELILGRGSEKSLDVFGYVITGAVGLAGLGAMTYALTPSGQWLWAGYETRPYTALERSLTETRVLWTYLAMILTPRIEAFALYHDDIIVSRSLLHPWSTLPATVGLLGIVALAWWSRRRAPVVSFGIAWFLVGHVLESTIFPLELAHEHRNYVPILGLLLPIARGIELMTRRTGAVRTLGVVLGVTTIGYPAFVTVMRAHLFGDEIRRTQLEAQYHPNSARTHYDAGRALIPLAASGSEISPAYSFAVAHFERVGDLDPRSKLGWLGLIHLDCMVGARPRKEWVDQLELRLRDTRFAPADHNALNSVKEMSIAGTLCLDRAEVQRIFDGALGNESLSPSMRATIYSWLADYLTLKERDLVAARTALDQSLDLAPGNRSNRLKQAQLAYLLGDRDEAEAILVGLKDAGLTQAERATYWELVACVEARDTRVTCIVR